MADALGLPFAKILSQTEPKRWHVPRHALRQAAFVCTLPEPAPTMVVIVDDLVTSGRTMRLSIEAIRAARVAGFGFSYSGCRRQITGGELVMSTDRDANGRFLPGHPGMGGRPRRAVEQDYLAALADAVTLDDWREIVERAREDAKRGDPKARRWLSDLLVGRQPEPLTSLAATELAGTLDEDIRVRAAGLRGNVFKKKILNRVSTYPDLNPGRPSEGSDVGAGPPDFHIDLGASQPGRNGHHR